ncbi:MAG: radical SAM protein, partial [Oscillospiraceae bacterium]
MIEHILRKVAENLPLSSGDAVALLKTDNQSSDFYRLIGTANELSRREYASRGYLFAQIGLNAAPCSGGCKFCSLGAEGYAVEETFQKSLPQVLELAETLSKERLDSLFLMSTADYPFETFLEIGGAVRRQLPPGIRLIANYGDFDLAQAQRLKAAGFHGAYHIVRLREGVDTDIPKERRLRTLDAIRASGLELYYCVEPIGPEHTYEELAEEMLRAREYGVDVMAVMGRIGVPGTACASRGEVSDLELTKIAAVTRLVTRPKRSMNVHEPKSMPL